MRKLISLLASALIALPSGIATASEIDIENNGDINIKNDFVRLNVSEDSGVRINTYRGNIYIPRHLPRFNMNIPRYENFIPFDFWESKQTIPTHCSGRSISQKSYQSNSSTSINQSSSSVTTTLCQ